MVPIYFSTLSTSLAPVFISFSNDIYNISAIRADPGLSSLSSIVAYSTISQESTFFTIYNQYNSLLVSTTEQINAISDLKGYDSNAYLALDLASVVPVLTSQFISTSILLSTNLLYFVDITSTTSSLISSIEVATNSSFSSVQLTFTSTLSNLNSNYQDISTLVSTNIYNPMFSSFYADIVTTSSLTIYNELITSSLGIRVSSSETYPLSLKGSFLIQSQDIPLNPYVYVGASTTTSNTIWVGSTFQSGFTSNIGNAFRGEGRDVAYNGSRWVAVGASDLDKNFIKTTTNPLGPWANASIDFDLTSQTTFNAVKWNGSYWLAGGGPSTCIVSSFNGTQWGKSDYGSTLTFVNGLAWNGYTWVATGSNIGPYTSIYSQTGTTWQGGVNSFDGYGNDVTTNGLVWVAVGSNPSIQFSFNARNWFPVTGTTFSTIGNAVSWNGEKFVAVGQNENTSNILFSYTGQTWSYASTTGNTDSYFSTAGNKVLWDGVRWIASGRDRPSDTLAKQLVSFDGILWSTFSLSTGILRGSAYASNTAPSIRLPNFDIYSGDIPVLMDSRKRMAVQHSSIYFNDGDLTIRTGISSPNLGYIGINNVYPEYALDIGVGNARKPSGTTWVTASDRRVKENIHSADLESCAKIVEKLPLRQFKYSQLYKDKTGVSDQKYLGFIAQEVKSYLPQSVRISNEFGLEDFHSLDTDQLFKLEFGATQYLLQQVKELEAIVSTLESNRKKET
jgi:hypothetical protein